MSLPTRSSHNSSNGDRPVDRFDGEYMFLSNFYPSPVSMYGKTYPTVEHAFQAAKSLDPVVRECIRNAPTPGVAKRMGRRIEMRSDWDVRRVGVMQTLLARKFSDPQLADKLLATTPRDLVEGIRGGDWYWGVCRGQGQNHLGLCLMSLRALLRSGGVVMATQLRSLCHFCSIPIPDGERAIGDKTGAVLAHFECWYDGTPFPRDLRDPKTGKLLSA